MAKKGGRPRKDDQGGGGGNDDAAAQRQLLIEAWKARDELYQSIFGIPSYSSPANYSAPSAVLKKKKKVDLNTVNGGSGDPGEPEAEEQHLAVLAYGPDPLRNYWTYVTAGLSSPWIQDAPEEVSGFGCELMIKSPTDATWPAQVLRSLAFYIFNHAGTISPGVRIALNAPIKEHSDSLLRNLFVWYADEAPDTWYILPSGGFGLFCAVGITEDELHYAESVEEYGTWCIQEALRRMAVAQLSDPDRNSVVTDDNAEMLRNVKIFANNFRADLSMRGGENE